jgi:hypothetical protein
VQTKGDGAGDARGGKINAAARAKRNFNQRGYRQICKTGFPQRCGQGSRLINSRAIIDGAAAAEAKMDAMSH